MSPHSSWFVPVFYEDGDNVSAYGLFVEHNQKYQVIWNGENGKTIFFQNEMPYDPPNQASWVHDGIKGYTATCGLALTLPRFGGQREKALNTTLPNTEVRQ